MVQKSIYLGVDYSFGNLLFKVDALLEMVFYQNPFETSYKIVRWTYISSCKAFICIMMYNMCLFLWNVHEL